MPHQCTTCERVFPDGSKEMLSGCPDCGGNKFQFKPDSATDATASSADTGSTTEPADAGPATPDSSTSDPSSTAADPDSDLIEAESDPSVLATDGEDAAQADARSDVVTSNELDQATTAALPDDRDDADRAVSPDSGSDDSPDIADLRRELNDQFESIKILEPGQYELNLMELYDRQECIISLQEDGHYVIEVADTWRDRG
jgi:predicted  nucleic acid-binding Zn-ribbon protein